MKLKLGLEVAVGPLSRPHHFPWSWTCLSLFLFCLLFVAIIKNVFSPKVVFFKGNERVNEQKKKIWGADYLSLCLVLPDWVETQQRCGIRLYTLSFTDRRKGIVLLSVCASLFEVLFLNLFSSHIVSKKIEQKISLLAIPFQNTMATKDGGKDTGGKTGSGTAPGGVSDRKHATIDPGFGSLIPCFRCSGSGLIVSKKGETTSLRNRGPGSPFTNPSSPDGGSPMAFVRSETGLFLPLSAYAPSSHYSLPTSPPSALVSGEGLGGGVRLGRGDIHPTQSQPLTTQPSQPSQFSSAWGRESGLTRSASSLIPLSGIPLRLPTSDSSTTPSLAERELLRTQKEKMVQNKKEETEVEQANVRSPSLPLSPSSSKEFLTLRRRKPVAPPPKPPRGATLSKEQSSGTTKTQPEARGSASTPSIYTTLPPQVQRSPQNPMLPTSPTSVSPELAEGDGRGGAIVGAGGGRERDGKAEEKKADLKGEERQTIPIVAPAGAVNITRSKSIGNLRPLLEEEQHDYNIFLIELKAEIARRARNKLYKQANEAISRARSKSLGSSLSPSFSYR